MRIYMLLAAVLVLVSNPIRAGQENCEHKVANYLKSELSDEKLRAAASSAVKDILSEVVKDQLSPHEERGIDLLNQTYESSAYNQNLTTASSRRFTDLASISDSLNTQVDDNGDLNLVFSFQNDGGGQGYKSQLGFKVKSDPQLNDALAAKIDTEDNEAALRALRSDINSFGDIEATFSYKFFGRKRSGSTFTSAFRARRTNPIALLIEKNVLINPVDELCAKHFDKINTASLKFFHERSEKGNSLMENGDLTNTARMDLEGALSHVRPDSLQALANTGFRNALIATVNNQPKFTVSGFYRFRDDLVGPDSYGVEFQYGQPLVKPPKAASLLSSDSLSPELEKKLKAEHRGYLNLKLEKIENYAPVIRTLDFDNPLTVSQSTIRRYTATLGYSRFFRADQGLDERLQFDLSGSYQDHSDNKDLNDRAILEATLAVPMGKNLVMPFSLIWASKPEFLGDVNQELSANIGIKWAFEKPE